MTRDDLWRIFTKRNPALLGDGAEAVTLRRRGIKKIFDAAYAAGLEAGEHATFGDVEPQDDVPEFMRELFPKN